jgi:hypothetical protein
LPINPVVRLSLPKHLRISLATKKWIVHNCLRGLIVEYAHLLMTIKEA